MILSFLHLNKLKFINLIVIFYFLFGCSRTKLNSQEATTTQTSSSSSPTLTKISTLTGAVEDLPFVISYSMLSAASDAGSPVKKSISFRVESLTSGTLKKNDTNVTAGSTTLAKDENLVWTPTKDIIGNIQAFSVKAFDGTNVSASAVTVTITVSDINDVPVVSTIADQTTRAGVPLRGLTFTVDEGGGSDEDAQSILATVSSSNTAVIANSNVTVNYTSDGTAAASGGTIDVIPMLATGDTTIILTVSDGTVTSQSSFKVTVSAAPISTTGLALWLPADGIVTKDASNLISKWTDISTSGIVFAQGTASMQPKWVSDGGSSFGNKPVVRFTKSSNTYLSAGDVLNTVLSGADKQTTLFIVFKATAGGAANQSLFNKAADSTCGENNRQFWFYLDSADKLLASASYALTGGQSNTAVSSNVVTGASKIISYQYDGSQDANTGNNRILFWVNGQKETFTPTATGALGDIPTGTSPLSIGANICTVGTPFSPLDGDIAEIILYSRVLTINERQTVEAFLSSKYKVTSIPTGNQAIWLRPDIGLYADTSCTIPVASNGANIGCWADQSGAGNHMTNSDTTKQPTVKTAGINNVTSVHVDVNGSTLKKLNVASGFTSMFAVAQQERNLSPAEWHYFAQMSGTSEYMGLFVDNDNSRLRVWSQSETGVTSTVNVSNTMGGQLPWIHSANYSDFAVSLFGNGQWIGNRPAPGPKMSIYSDVHINAYFDTGEIGDLLAYSSEVNAFDRNRIENYLNVKYKIGSTYKQHPVFNATDLQLWLMADAGLSGADTASQFTAANSEYLSVGDNAALSTGNIDYSIAAWVYLDSKSTDVPIISKWGGAPNFEYWLGYESAADRFSFYISNDGTSGSSIKADNLGSPSVGKWYFIVASHDATNDKLTIQVNDGTVSQTTYASGGFDSPTNLRIGYDSTTYFGGRMQKMGFWKKVLSTSETKQLYNAGKGRMYLALDTGLKTNLISYWELGETSGTRNDSHSTNHLTDNNTVTGSTGTGANISSWADQSGNGLNLSQGTPANRPAWYLDTFGIAAIRFNGTTHSLDGSFAGNIRNIGDRDAFTAIVVAQPFDTTTRALIGTTGAATPDFILRYVGQKMQLYGGQSAANSSAVSTTNVPTASRSILSVSDDAGGIKYFLNGAADGTATHLTYGVADANIYIGKWSTQFWYGDISEVIMYSKALSTAERQAVECYLSAKYTITLSGVTCP